MSITTHCPQCGAAWPHGTLQGLCPRCIARQAANIMAAKGAAAAAKDGFTSSDIASRSSVSFTLRYFGDYELLEEIARGGMGIVWKARQVSLNRTVAVKMLLAGRFSNPEFVQRFRAEAEAAAQLHHPNIVAIYEVGEHEGHHYFAMDYIEGENLSQLVRNQPLPARRAARYLQTVAQAVGHAHQHGVLHRDLKPANILIDDTDQPRVTDFGLAKRLNNSELETQNSELTLSGQVLGTPGFMSPEQAGGKRGAVGPAGDVYSLGAVLYFLVTGRAPFASGSLEETLRQVHETEPVSPRLLNPAIPRDLETICLKSLNKEPTRRYVSAQALSEDLERFLNDEPIYARPARAPEKVLRWCRRKPALATAMLALLIVGAAGLAGILWQWRRAQTNADAATQQSLRAEQHAARETVQRVRAEEAVALLELQRAEDLLEKDEVVMGLAHLARIVRQQPTNQVASRRLLSVLTQRNFALPVGPVLRHEKRVRNAEFSPDGRWVLTAGLDLTAGIWDARTGQRLHTLVHPGAVRSARFSPDSARLVTTADDFQARLWDANTGRPLGQPMVHTREIRPDFALFSHDGRRVLTASDDGTARVWNGFTGEPLLQPLTHQGPIVWAQFTSDDSGILTASRDRTVQVWDALTGQPVGPPFQHEEVVWLADLSPNGKRLITALQHFTTCLWDVESRQQLRKPWLHPQPVTLVGFSPEGERVLTEAGMGMIQVWNVGDWTSAAKPMMHRRNVWTARFSPEGQRLLTASMDATARLWDATKGEPLTAPLEHDDLVFSARFSPDGDFAVTASADQTARIWDVRPGTMRNLPLPNPIREELAQAKLRLPHATRSALGTLAQWIGMDFSPDGEWAVNGWDSQSARLWNARTYQPGVTLTNAGLALLMRFSPDGERVATCSIDGVTQIWEARNGREITRIGQSWNLGEIKFSPDGQWLAGACTDKTLRQWNALTGQLRREPLLQRGSIQFFCYSPDGQRLVTSDFKDDVVWLYEAATGRLLARTPAREGRMTHADFSRDGRRLITASEDATARIWDGHTLQSLIKPMRHKGSVTWVKFSHDGRWVVTGSDYGAARVWNSQNGEPIGEPMNHRAAVCSAEFSPDDRLVVTAARNGTVRLWDTRSGQPVSEPFTCAAGNIRAGFSADSRQVFILSEPEEPRVCDVPPVSDSGRPLGPSLLSGASGQAQRAGETDPTVATALLADLAETVIGKRINDRGEVESIAAAGITPLRQRVANLPRESDFTRWLEWFLADRSARTISPNSPITVPEYVARLMEQKTLAAAREAVLLAPTNAPALAYLAEMLLTSPGSNPPVTIAEAQFLLRRAGSLAPDDLQVQETCRRVSRRFEKQTSP